MLSHACPKKPSPFRRRLFTTNLTDNFPLWSPRGDLIMFARLSGGTYDVYTIRPDGSSLKRLTNGSGNHRRRTTHGQPMGGRCTWVAGSSSAPDSKRVVDSAVGARLSAVRRSS